MFEWSAAVDDFRCWETSALRAARDEAVVEQRKWRARELAVLRVRDCRARSRRTRR